MPIFFHQDIEPHTKLAVWKIEEDEAFFGVPLQRSITHPHKRLQHLAGRFLLRYLFPDFPLELILIADTRKPYLEDEAYHFSISHCGDYAAVLVSKNRRVGVDVEIPTEKVLRITGKFLHKEEQHSLQAATTVNDITEMATVLWSAKEAVFKWWGRGEVDFSEMIRLDSLPLGTEATMVGRFVKEQTVPLTVAYRLFPNLCLAWVVSD